MSRDWTSRGFAPQRTPPPAAYVELVDFFGGDADAADAWLAGQLAYAGDAATAEQLLAALVAAGPPNVVEFKLDVLLSGVIDGFDIIAETAGLAGDNIHTDTLAGAYIFTVS